VRFIGVTEMTQQYLRRKEAANYVRQKFGMPCSNNWLAKLACEGGGPAFRKAGRFPLYDPADLDAWATARIGPKLSSTSVQIPETDRLPESRLGGRENDYFS